MSVYTSDVQVVTRSIMVIITASFITADVLLLYDFDEFDKQ
jgi:hypothetical protein